MITTKNKKTFVFYALQKSFFIIAIFIFFPPILLKPVTVRADGEGISDYQSKQSNRLFLSGLKIFSEIVNTGARKVVNDVVNSVVALPGDVVSSANYLNIVGFEEIFVGGAKTIMKSFADDTLANVNNLNERVFKKTADSGGKTLAAVSDFFGIIKETALSLPRGLNNFIFDKKDRQAAENEPDVSAGVDSIESAADSQKKEVSPNNELAKVVSVDNYNSDLKILERKYDNLNAQLSLIKQSGLVIEGPVIERKTIERLVEKTVSVSDDEETNKKLADMETRLNNQISNLSSQTSRQFTGAYQTISLTNKIDNLSNITLSNVSGLADSDIPDDITASNYLPLSGGTLTGALVGASASFASTLTVSASTTFNGVEYKWPFSDGTANQVLATNGSGGLSWTTVSGGSGASYDWQKETNYGALTLTPTTTIPVWFKDAVYASSTLTVQGLTTLGNASSTVLSATSLCLSADCRTSWPASGSGASYDWQKETNYGALTLTPTTTIPVWFKDSIYASTTSIFQGLATFGNASTSQISANTSYLGTVSQGTWNGATIGVGYGGTGLTSYTQGDVLYASGATTLAGTTTANLKTTLSLNNVENTALSTWAGSSNITTLGTISSGSWNGTLIGVPYGGTGWASIQSGAIPYGNGTSALSTTTAGTAGNILALLNGVPTWTATSTLSNISGTLNLGTQVTGTLGVANGGTGQTSFAQGWLNSDGTTISASTSPTVAYLTATSTAATSTFPYLSVTTNSNLGTVIGGAWQGTPIGDAYLTKSGDWTGTLDTYEASSLLSRANHTGTQNMSTLSNYDFAFSSNYGTNNLTGSTTMPWWAQGGLNASSTSRFVYASTTALTVSGNSYLGTVSQGTWNGAAIGVGYGGTGLTSISQGQTLVASDANTLQATSTLAILSSGNVGIGTTTPNWTTQIAGTRPFLTLSDTSAGTNNKHWFMTSQGGNFYMGTSTDALSATSTYLTINKSGNVGIGTTSPFTAFSVQGNHVSGTGIGTFKGNAGLGYVTLDTTTGGSGALSGFVFKIAGTKIGELSYLGDDNSMNIYNNIFSSSPMMTFSSGGNVGVGTTSPYAKLSVSGDTALDSMFVNFASSSAPSLTLNYLKSATSTIPNNTIYAWTIATSTSVAPIFAISTNGTGATAATTSVNGGLNIDSGGIIYDSSSGITTINSLEAGPMNFDDNAGTVSWFDMSVTSASAVNTKHSYTAQIDSNPVLTVYGESDGGGNAQNFRVGIGTTTPLHKLSIHNATTSSAVDADIGFTATSTGLMSWYNWTMGIDQSDGGKFKISSSTALGTNDKLVIDGSGQVGIATSSPWRTFDVSGTVGFKSLTTAVGTGSLCLSSNNEVTYNAADTCLSSLRDTKHDIETLTVSGLDLLSALEPVSFIYNESYGDDRVRYGFIAEDAAGVDSHFASYNGSTMSGIDDRAILSVAVKAIKELNLKVDSLVLDGKQPDGQSLFDSVVSKLKGTALSVKEFITDKITAKEIKTDKICIGETCVTEEQFKNVFGNSQSASSSSRSSSSSQSSISSSSSEAATSSQSSLSSSKSSSNSSSSEESSSAQSSSSSEEISSSTSSQSSSASAESSSQSEYSSEASQSSVSSES